MRLSCHVTGPFDYALLLPPLASCLDRIQTRIGHEFDDEAAARSMHEQFADVCGQCAEHVIDSSIGTPDDVADVIMDRRSSGLLQAH